MLGTEIIIISPNEKQTDNCNCNVINIFGIKCMNAWAGSEEREKNEEATLNVVACCSRMSFNYNYVYFLLLSAVHCCN